MKQYKIIQFGKTKDKGLLELQKEYEFRLSKFHAIERITWKNAEKKEASERVVNYIGEHPLEHVFVLDESGAGYNTKEFHRILEKHHADYEIVTFIIGDAQGFDARVRKEANIVSLSKMTFPHELAVTLLLEQLYRVETIKHNHPYHKE